MDHRIIELDGQPEAVRQFFAGLGDEPVLLRMTGEAIGVFYPADELPEIDGPDIPLEDLAGAWDDLPDEVDQIG